MSATPRLRLPLLAAGQAQKELFHNEALQLLDALVAASVEEPPRAEPPAAPAIGSCYLLAGSPTGAWSGHAHALAIYSAAGWRFIAPVEGMTVSIRDSGLSATYRGGSWDVGMVSATGLWVGGKQVVGPQAAAITGPVGGSSIDAQCREAVERILAALRQHGLVET
ncbi:MAG TPA: DUF2793 domain-containing protein [Sphingomicrobium sp.]|nr:DUF2793 domain-containing protein [Sphingomicrobium sp.]